MKLQAPQRIDRLSIALIVVYYSSLPPKPGEPAEQGDAEVSPFRTSFPVAHWATLRHHVRVLEWVRIKSKTLAVRAFHAPPPASVRQFGTWSRHSPKMWMYCEGKAEYMMPDKVVTDLARIGMIQHLQKHKRFVADWNTDMSFAGLLKYCRTMLPPDAWRTDARDASR